MFAGELLHSAVVVSVGGLCRSAMRMCPPPYKPRPSLPPGRRSAALGSPGPAQLPTSSAARGGACVSVYALLFRFIPVMKA